MSTLPDPRGRSRSPASEEGHATLTHHPDLNEEVATLSTKLVNAINHQTCLEDTLSATRQELQAANARIKELEAQNATQREMMAGDVWVRRSTLDGERKSMQAKLAGETSRRRDVERDKRKIEQELENLTADLFEEANKMVIQAKEEAKADHQALQRKNDQLRAQLANAEGLLTSQQEQLSELKAVMETMASEREDQTNGTAPSTPSVARLDAQDEDEAGKELAAGGCYRAASASAHENPSPSHPTSFHHLIQLVLRTDLASYEDFVTLARMSRRQAGGNRASSGSTIGLSAMALALGGSTSSAHQSNNSTSSLGPPAGGSGSNSAPQSPKTAAGGHNGSSSPKSTSPNTMTPPGSATAHLKDTRFFKRVLAEDVDPTLRLDTAPGLSWLARRSVITAMAEGSLVVEPVPTTGYVVSVARPQLYPCALCGESRTEELHLRRHRFRTSEADSAQKYPLCRYCLARVRSTCDLLGFLRMVKDGLFRVDDEDHERNAWEESVRLREQMFWARIGGGVVPVVGQHAGGGPAGASHSPDAGRSQPVRTGDDKSGEGSVGYSHDTAATAPEEQLSSTSAPGTGPEVETADAACLDTRAPEPASSEYADVAEEQASASDATDAESRALPTSPERTGDPNGAAEQAPETPSDEPASSPKAGKQGSLSISVGMPTR